MTKDKAEIILDKCVEYLLYAMIAFIPISISAIEISFSLALLAFLIKKVLKPDFGFVKNFTHLFLFLFFGFCALSLFNSEVYFTKSLRALFFKWLQYIFIFIIVEDTLNTSKRLRNAIFILLGVSGLIGLSGIVQQFRGVDFLRQRVLVDGGRITATFQNQNSFAAYLVPVLLLVTSLAIFPQLKKQYKWILFFLGSLLGICLILTFSRGAWLGFFVGLVLMLLIFRNKIKRTFLPVCIFIIILMSIPALRQRVISVFQPGGDAMRFSIWKNAWAMIVDNPFLGKGLGTFMDHFPKCTNLESPYYAHNFFLQIWAEAGIFALLSFLLFVGSILHEGTKVFKKSSPQGLSMGLLLGLLCAIFGFLVHSFFDTNLYSLQLAVLFWFILGLAVSIQRIK